MASTLATLLEKSLETEGRQRTVCFVCSGNTCRSPMAEAYFNHISLSPEICTACDPRSLMGRKNVRALSAGLAAFGEPICDKACAALEAAGVISTPQNDYRSHVATAVELEVVKNADLVVGMTSSHALRLMTLFPQFASKITCMPKEISDPWGGGLEDYKLCLERIIEGVKEIYEKL